MANAKKCDLCKICYDPLDQGSKLMCKFVNPIFQNSEDVRNGKVTKYLSPGGEDIYLDLCPDCTEKFVEFMYGRKFKMEDRDKMHCVQNCSDCWLTIEECRRRLEKEEK